MARPKPTFEDEIGTRLAEVHWSLFTKYRDGPVGERELERALLPLRVPNSFLLEMQEAFWGFGTTWPQRTRDHCWFHAQSFVLEGPRGARWRIARDYILLLGRREEHHRGWFSPLFGEPTAPKKHFPEAWEALLASEPLDLSVLRELWMMRIIRLVRHIEYEKERRSKHHDGWNDPIRREIHQEMTVRIFRLAQIAQKRDLLRACPELMGCVFRLASYEPSTELVDLILSLFTPRHPIAIPD